MNNETINLFYFIKSSTGDVGYQHYTGIIGSSHHRNQIRAIENDPEFCHWTVESKEIIEKYFTELHIIKPKIYSHGNRR